MCVIVTLPDGQEVRESDQFAELIEQMGGNADPVWSEEPSCLCGVDVLGQLRAASVIIDGTDNTFDVVVPAQSLLPARYVCQGGPLDGRPPFRVWGDEPTARFTLGITRSGGKHEQYVYALDGDRYVLVKPKPKPAGK